MSGSLGRRGLSETVLSHTILLLLCAVTLFPMYWMFATSLKAPNDIFDFFPIPRAPTLDNYAYVWRAIPIASMMTTTFLNATLQMLGHLFLGLITAYAFARWRFPGDDLLFLAFVGTWLVPFQVTMIPNYVLLAQLGWLNSLAALVIPNLGSAFGVLLLRQYIRSFPRDLMDAAQVDGASSWGILWRVVVPNLRAPLAALAILSFISSWNEYFWPLLVTNRIDQTVIQVGLQMFLTGEGEQWGALMAAATIATLPVLIIYLLCQRHVIDAFVRAGIR